MSKSEKFLPRFLFASVALLLLSFFISNNILKTSSFVLPLMSACYLFNIFTFIFYVLRNKIVIKKNNFGIMILLFVFSMMTILVNYNGNFNKNNLYDLINVFVKSVNLLCYVIIFMNIRMSKEQLLYLMKLFVILGIIACIYNFMFNYREILSFYKISSTYDLSLSSIFSNRNQFGAYLFLAVVAYTFVLSDSRKTMKNYYIYILFIINIFLTMSRGAILATAIFIIYSLIKQKKYKTICAMIIGGGVLIAIITLFFPLYEFINDNILRLDSGTTGRTSIWNVAIKVWKRTSTIFGAGYYNGLSIAKNIYNFKYSQFHSCYFDIIVDGGITLLIILGYIILKCYILSKKCSDKSLRDTMKGAYISIFAFSIFESVNFLSLGYADMLYTVFFMTIPIILSNINTLNKEECNNVCN